jgi:hypothetical protein
MSEFGRMAAAIIVRHGGAFAMVRWRVRSNQHFHVIQPGHAFAVSRRIAPELMFVHVPLE